ncbi:hypothetical protein [Legionella septentrionalis]|uniref:hypothetical protein n=1 Tax=Legionella septentrionalis TaxID=2498109 RepID=UPI000F8F2CE6|nr:hypothetical protein [Legionella septentrionalis]RUQ99361.1 hypothetical protein ELY11_04885 [Legionella septentrionalis]
MKMKKLAFSILAASPLFFLNTAHASESPKEASSSTTTLNNELLKKLPFSDKESFNKKQWKVL